MGGTPLPPTMLYLAGQREEFQKLSKGSETLCMTSEGLGEMFEGDFADMCAANFRWCLAEDCACANLPARTPLAPAEFHWRKTFVI